MFAGGIAEAKPRKVRLFDVIADFRVQRRTENENRVTKVTKVTKAQEAAPDLGKSGYLAEVTTWVTKHETPCRDPSSISLPRVTRVSLPAVPTRPEPDADFWSWHAAREMVLLMKDYPDMSLWQDEWGWLVLLYSSRYSWELADYGNRLLEDARPYLEGKGKVHVHQKRWTR